MDSYELSKGCEYTHEFHHRHGGYKWEDFPYIRDGRRKRKRSGPPLIPAYRRNEDWLRWRLGEHGLYFDEIVFKTGETPKGLGPAKFVYDGVMYNLSDGWDALKILNKILGTNETALTAAEYAEKLKERKMKNECERCDMGRD